jgi:glucokinase
MGKAWLGIDLGGTNTRVGLVDLGGLVAREHFSTEAAQGTGQWLDNLRQAAYKLSGQGLKPAGVGVASPGIIQRPQGVVTRSPNLPAWNGFPLADEVGKALGLPTQVENDANCYALGEFHFGAGGGRDLACFTLGTGVGGGLIIDGKLVIGPLGTGSELGHTLAVNGGRTCGCGAKGCVESYASATGLLGMLSDALDQGRETELGRKSKASDIAAAAQAGDGLAQELFSQAGWALGQAFANVATFTGLDLIILGGGVSSSWPLMANAAENALQERLHLVPPKRIEIRLAQLGDDAPLLGAPAIARDN